MCPGFAMSALLLWCLILSAFGPLSHGSFLNILRGHRDEFSNTKPNCTDMTTGRTSCGSFNAECSSNSSCCVCRCLYSHAVFRYLQGCVDNAAIRSKSGCKYQFSSVNSLSPLVILDLSKPGSKRIDAPRSFGANSSCEVVGTQRVLDRGTWISSKVKNYTFSLHKTNGSYFELHWKNVSGSLWSGRLMTVPIYCKVNSSEHRSCLLFKIQGTLTYAIDSPSPTPTAGSTAISELSTTLTSVGHFVSVSSVMPTRTTATQIHSTASVVHSTPEPFLSWWPLSKIHFIIVAASVGFIITVLFILCIWLIVCRRSRKRKASRGVVRQSATHLFAQLEMMDAMSASNEAFTETSEEETSGSLNNSPSPEGSPDCLRTDSKVQIEPLYQNLARDDLKFSANAKERLPATPTTQEHLHPLPSKHASFDVLMTQGYVKEEDRDCVQNDDEGVTENTYYDYSALTSEDADLPYEIVEREPNKETAGDEEDEQYELMGITPDADSDYVPMAGDEDGGNDIGQNEMYMNVRDTNGVLYNDQDRFDGIESPFSNLPPYPSSQESPCSEVVYELPPDSAEGDAAEKEEDGVDQEYCYADYSQPLAERAQIEQHLRKSWPCVATPPVDESSGTDEPIYMNINNQEAIGKASTLAVPGCDSRAGRDDVKKRPQSWVPRTKHSNSDALQKPKIAQDSRGMVNSERSLVLLRPQARASNQRGTAAREIPKNHLTKGGCARPQPKPRPLTVASGSTTKGNTKVQANIEDGNISLTQSDAPEQRKSEGDFELDYSNDEEPLYVNRDSFTGRFDIN